MSAINIFSPNKRFSLLSLTILLLSGWCFGQATIKLSATSGWPSYGLRVSGSNFSAAAAVNIYFDTTLLTSASSDSTGSFSNVAIKIPASALPGTHYITAIALSTNTSAKAGFMVQTNWIQSGFDSRTGLNPYENVLSPANVGSLKEHWSYRPIGDGVFSYSTPVVANGIAYLASAADNKVYALDANTGRFRWSFAEPTRDVWFGTAVGWGMVYTGSSSGLYALNAKTGALLWSYTDDSCVAGSPTLSNGTVFATSCGNGIPSYGKVIALNANTGSLVWSFPTGNLQAKPAVTTNAVYVGGSNKVYALNPRTGALLWSSSIRGTHGSVAVGNDAVYLGLDDGTVIAMNACNGAILWRYNLGVATNLFSPAIANGVVYVNSTSTVYALNASTGRLLWTASAPPQCCGYATFLAWAGPTVANGVVYVTGQPLISALNAATGALLGSFQQGGVSTAGAAVVNGMIYVAADGGVLYGLGQ